MGRTSKWAGTKSQREKTLPDAGAAGRLWPRRASRMVVTVLPESVACLQERDGLNVRADLLQPVQGVLLVGAEVELGRGAGLLGQEVRHL